jgi:hypothetical protein
MIHTIVVIASLAVVTLPVHSLSPLSMGFNSGSTNEVMVYASSTARSRQISQCTWTSPSGVFYDFTELAKTGENDDYLVNIPHSDFAMLVNLCANALKVPARCAAKASSQASVGFQWNTKQPKSCWELGEVSTVQFSYTDESSPEKGVDIMYSGGTPCSKGVRMVHSHMVCAGRGSRKSAPSFAWESPTCHYHIVWPTPLACPGVHSFSFFAFIEDSFLFIVFAIVLLAICISVRKNQSDGTPIKDTMADLYSRAADRSFDFVSSIKSRFGGISGGAANRTPQSAGGSSSGGEFGAGGMSPMPMSGDAL